MSQSCSKSYLTLVTHEQYLSSSTKQNKISHIYQKGVYTFTKNLTGKNTREDNDLYLSFLSHKSHILPTSCSWKRYVQTTFNSFIRDE